MAQSQDVVAECPTCKAVVPLDATECPQCGELFDQEVATGGLGSANVTETDQSSDKDGTEEPKTGFREKFLFYTGIFLILLGGPGIALRGRGVKRSSGQALGRRGGGGKYARRGKTRL
ncbi:MAG: zinc ribbon domain-containing protein [Methanobacteriota archaeon]|nr:MAG: zinc ribbon domain-containing protein [Euryarchaeota archaeon]